MVVNGEIILNEDSFVKHKHPGTLVVKLVYLNSL